MSRSWVIGLLCASAALAQPAPESVGGSLPLTPPPPPIPTPLTTAAASRNTAPLAPNLISVYGAEPLGTLTRGEAFMAGFPLVSIRVLMGVGPRVDLGVGFDSYYGVMNEFRLSARTALLTGSTWSLGASLEAGGALFGVKATREFHGARWITGRRNFNFEPQLRLTYRGAGARAARVTFDAHYLLTLDTEPFSRSPLDGVPPAVTPGHNAGVGVTVEAPLSPTTSFVFIGRFDIHGRAEDAPVMPMVQLGLVTSL